MRLSYIKPLAPYNPFSAEFPHCARDGLKNTLIGATLYAVAAHSSAQGLATGLKDAKNCSVKLAAPKALFAAINMDKVGARIAANPAGSAGGGSSSHLTDRFALHAQIRG